MTSRDRDRVAWWFSAAGALAACHAEAPSAPSSCDVDFADDAAVAGATRGLEPGARDTARRAMVSTGWLEKYVAVWRDETVATSDALTRELSPDLAAQLRDRDGTVASASSRLSGAFGLFRDSRRARGALHAESLVGACSLARPETSRCLVGCGAPPLCEPGARDARACTLENQAVGCAGECVATALLAERCEPTTVRLFFDTVDPADARFLDALGRTSAWMLQRRDRERRVGLFLDDLSRSSVEGLARVSTQGSRARGCFDVVSRRRENLLPLVVALRASVTPHRAPD